VRGWGVRRAWRPYLWGMTGRSQYPGPDAAAALHRALSGPTPAIPPRWFWDRRGADLHRVRTGLVDHYPARVERELYEEHAPMLVGLFEPLEVADLVPAASRHVRALAGALLGGRPSARCALLDLDPERLVASVRRLAADFPRLEVRGELGDCFGPTWPLGQGGARLLLLSAVGPDGLDAPTLLSLLRRLAARLEPDDALVFGVDLGQDPAALLRACDDSEGMAAAFHRNVLRVINERFGAELDPARFSFEAVWDAARRRVETRLRPMCDGTVTLAGAEGVIALDPDRPWVTGRVGTWTRSALRERVEGVGLGLSAWLTDPDERRALVVLQRAARG
jgi:L-histidine N-alpha-methyltransferase